MFVKSVQYSLLLLPQRQEFSSKSQPSISSSELKQGCCCYHKGRNFQANHNRTGKDEHDAAVVVATTKVGIFKQITTKRSMLQIFFWLLLLPQRQEFSSKSQQYTVIQAISTRCCCYHKGRNFQANHNRMPLWYFSYLVVVATTKVGIFKQITTPQRVSSNLWTLLLLPQRQEFSSKSQRGNFISDSALGCCCYHKGRNFQANHNHVSVETISGRLLLLPQRQEFSSKSQPKPSTTSKQTSCCCYHKGRNFQANHNSNRVILLVAFVVVATTKVGIFKQITTVRMVLFLSTKLLLLPQRQEFSSKSQPNCQTACSNTRCCCYHKGRNFQANHNR